MLHPPSRVLSFARLLRSATGLVFMAQAGGCAAGGQVEEDSAPGCGPLIKICTVKSAHRPLEKMYRSYNLLLMICARARVHTHTHTHQTTYPLPTQICTQTHKGADSRTPTHAPTHLLTHLLTHSYSFASSLARSLTWACTHAHTHTRTHAVTITRARWPVFGP